MRHDDRQRRRRVRAGGAVPGACSCSWTASSWRGRARSRRRLGGAWWRRSSATRSTRPARRRCRSRPTAFSRYIAPLTEETAKARLHRLPDLAGAASGFRWTRRSSGSPSAPASPLVENFSTCACSSTPASCCGWCAASARRCCTAPRPPIFAMLSQTASDRHPNRCRSVFVPGWLAAVAHPCGVQPRAAAAGGDDRAAAGRAAAARAVRVPAQRGGDARMGRRRARPRPDAARRVLVGRVQLHEVRHAICRSCASAFPVRSSPTCCACCASSSSCRCRPRRC